MTAPAGARATSHAPEGAPAHYLAPPAAAEGSQPAETPGPARAAWVGVLRPGRQRGLAELAGGLDDLQLSTASTQLCAALSSMEAGMNDLEPQTAAAKVLWHFLMSLDGFVAGPDHAMDWMTGFSVRPGLHAEYIETTGAVLAGRSGFDSAIGDSRPYGGAWQGPIFVLTHHPEDARPAEHITFLSCPVEEAVRIALDAAGGKNVEVFSPTIGRQLLALGLIDEIDLHIAPILLGDGIRLYDHPGGNPVRLNRLGEADPTAAVNLRYRPMATR